VSSDCSEFTCLSPPQTISMLQGQLL